MGGNFTSLLGPARIFIIIPPHPRFRQEKRAVNRTIAVLDDEEDILESMLPRDRLLDRLWGDGKVVTDRTIDVHIRNLRRKLGRRSDVIRNVRGAGYKLET